MNHRREHEQNEGFTDPSTQFDEIAFLYDDLMAGVPYDDWFEYIEGMLDRHECYPNLVLDLCCGTGTVSLMLAREGYQVTGVDISPEMIARAAKRAEAEGLSVDFRVQNAAKLRLDRRFDLIVSLFDSLNYILDSTDLMQAFQRAAEHLNPGGLLVFDVNTELALAAGLFTQNNLGSRSKVIYDWHSVYDSTARICRVDMTFWDRRGGSEKEQRIVHYQRAYEIDEIKQMLVGAGLDVLAVYSAYTYRPVSKKSDRAFFVARRRPGAGS